MKDVKDIKMFCKEIENDYSKALIKIIKHNIKVGYAEVDTSYNFELVKRHFVNKFFKYVKVEHYTEYVRDAEEKQEKMELAKSTGIIVNINNLKRDGKRLKLADKEQYLALMQLKQFVNNHHMANKNISSFINADIDILLTEQNPIQSHQTRNIKHRTCDTWNKNTVKEALKMYWFVTPDEFINNDLGDIRRALVVTKFTYRQRLALQEFMDGQHIGNYEDLDRAILKVTNKLNTSNVYKLSIIEDNKCLVE